MYYKGYIFFPDMEKKSTNYTVVEYIYATYSNYISQILMQNIYMALYEFCITPVLLRINPEFI